MLTLDRTFLVQEDLGIQGLKEAIAFGNELVREDGIAIMDYKIHTYNIN
jgi:hypothetical protein